MFKIAAPQDPYPPIQIIRKPEVLKKTRLSDPTLWRLEKAGKFPRRRQLGPNSVGWIESEVDEWIVNLPEAC